MPNLYDNTNLLDKSYDVYAKVQKRIGAPVPDEASFIGGFIACFGIITGKVDIGLDDNAPLSTILESIHKDIATFGQRIVEAQMKQDGFDKAMKQAVEATARAKRNGK
jgi:hypothetical protein